MKLVSYACLCTGMLIFKLHTVNKQFWCACKWTNWCMKCMQAGKCNMVLGKGQTNGQSIFANGPLDYFYEPSTVPVASYFLRTPLQPWHSFSTDCIIMHVSSILSVYIETISLQLVVDTEATINPQPPHHRPHSHVKQVPWYCGLEVCPVRTHVS